MALETVILSAWNLAEVLGYEWGELLEMGLASELGKMLELELEHVLELELGQLLDGWLVNE
jgi:hypothetical protein